MVKQLASKVRPKYGFAHYFHLSLVAILPLLVFIFVRIELVGVALAIILLSKWRIFAVRPRHWLAHLRTNAVDLIFSLSILAFIVNSDSMSWQLIWVLFFEVWVLYIKPGTSTLMVSVQALLAQMIGLVAVFVAFEESSIGVYIIFTSIISYFSARHFFGSFEEKYFNAYSSTWALFVAALTWLLSHWLLFYGPVAQLALMVSVFGYGLATLYYLAETDKLSKPLQKQVIFVMFVVTGLMVALSDWGSKTL